MNSTVLSETYEIQSVIGSGGGGTVYKAFHKRLQKTVVIKKTHIRRTSEAENRREADILKNLRHTYLPQVLDFIETEDTDRQDGTVGIYTVMDFIEGKSFQKLLSEGRIFSQKEAAKYGAQLLEALVYLHTQRIPILHGDIKPDNIILTPEDNICLIDFNISGVLSKGNDVTIGFTPGYASPEQIDAVHALQQRLSESVAEPIRRTPSLQDDDITAVLPEENDEKTAVLPYDTEATEIRLPSAEDPSVNRLSASDPDTADVLIDNTSRQIDARADLYSAGAFLYHLVTGQKPGKPGQVTPLSAWSNFSDAFAAVIDRSMAVDPDDRFPDARTMLSALLGYTKTDRRYKALVFRQTLISVAVLAGLIGCVFVATLGNNRMRTEKNDSYDALLASLSSAREAGDEDRFLALYDEALAENPDSLEPQVERAQFYYAQRRYADTTEWLENDVLAGTFPKGQEREIAELYYLSGSCFYELQDLKEAINRYQTALLYDTGNPEVYRDLAITLAQSGDTSQAGKVLAEAEQSGVPSDDLALVRGEIAAASGDHDTAAGEFRSCINDTDDDYVKLRAYVLWSDVLSAGSSDEQHLRESAALLEEARTVLPQDQTALILERLAQTEIRLNELTDDPSCAAKAAEIFEEIIDRGWGNLTTWNNLVVMVQSSGDIDKALSCAERMKQSYADRYETWKRLAFLETARQAQTDPAERSYEAFAEYYQKARDLYESQTAPGRTDTEMQILDNAYAEAKQGGWIS
ncbi:MAG: tetratricopeptide repeat protein [Lachnospiraceae bacterium]|nr:tetratricopeptide repeat protein [Lachnospiraceae bacterium]